MYRILFFLISIGLVKFIARPDTDKNALILKAGTELYSVKTEPCNQTIKPNGYLFLKDFKFNSNSPEHSYVLTKGTSYYIVICPLNESGGFEIYNSSREVVFKTPKNNEGKFVFNSSATGIYYFRLTGNFDSITASLSFKR